MKSKLDDQSAGKTEADFKALKKYLCKIKISDDWAQYDKAEKSNGGPSQIFHGPYKGNIIFVHPDERKPVSVEQMKASSLEVKNILDAKKMDVGELEQSLVMVAFPGDLLAFELENDLSSEVYADRNDQSKLYEGVTAKYLEPGLHVKLTVDGEYISEKFGFICLDNNRLDVLPPIKISSDMLTVEWLVPAKHPGRIDRDMIEFWLQDKGVKVEPIPDLDDLIARANEQNSKAAVHTIVSGQSPIFGEDGSIEWLVNIEHGLGKELSDGRIDFRELDYVVSVGANQPVAFLKRATKGLSGYDVYGNLLAAVDGNPKQLACGDNIIEKSIGNGTQYIAAIDGALHYQNNVVSVAEVLILPEGVNFNTGNINFAGDVIVQGNIDSGFSVNAGGNVTVAGTIENGCKINALENVIVLRNIIGKRTVVKAGGFLRVQCVHEATVKTDGNIFLGGYSFHAMLRAGGTIHVQKGSIRDGGSIMGGEAWACAGIDTYTAGTPAWGHTMLVAGILREQWEKIEEIRVKIEGRNTHIMQILNYFGMVSLDLNKIQELIDKTQGVQRKSMALRAKYLARFGKKLQELLAEREVVMAQLGPAPDNVEIRIRERIYPNVVVKIGNKNRKVNSELRVVRFRISKQELVAIG